MLTAVLAWLASSRLNFSRIGREPTATARVARRFAQPLGYAPGNPAQTGLLGLNSRDRCHESGKLIAWLNPLSSAANAFRAAHF